MFKIIGLVCRPLNSNGISPLTNHACRAFEHVNFMKAEMGMMMTNVSGKLGGQVATKGRNGLNIRTKVKPINRRTTSQVDVRSLLATVSQAWKGLTDAQRNAWTSAAQNFTHTNNFGQKFKPTGKNFFTEINLNLIIVGSAQVTSPPATTPPIGLTALTALSAGAGLLTASFAATPIAAANKAVVSATRGLSPGVAFVGKQYRQIQVFPAASATPFDLTAAYTTKFGAPVTGSRVFIRVKIIETVSGLPSIPLQSSVIIS